MAWVAIEDFNSYTPAGTSLSGGAGGSGWGANTWSLSGGTLVSDSTAYEGAFSVKATSAGLGGNNAERRLGTDLSGSFTFYCVIWKDVSNSGEMRWNFRDTGDNGRFSVVMDASDNIVLRSETGGTSQTIKTSYATSTFYVIKLVGDTAAGTVNGAWSTDAYGSAGSFSSATSDATFTAGDLRFVLVDFGASAGTGSTSRWDYLSPTNPFVSTGIKTINGVAKASVKTVNGVAIASVKTWNGIA